MDPRSMEKIKKTKSSSSDKRGRNDLTLQQRIEILDEIGRSKNVSASARMFSIDRRHAHKIKEQEKSIREAYTSGLIPSTRKRLGRSGGGSSVTVIPKKKKNEDGEEEDLQVVKIEVRSPATEEPQIDDSDVLTQDTHDELIGQSEGTSSATARSQSESGDVRASGRSEENVGVSQPEETVPITSPTTTGTSTGTTTIQHHTETVNTDSVQTDTESVQRRTEEDPVSDQSDGELSHYEEGSASIEFCYDQMGPLSNISLRTPGSVEVHEAAESLLSMDTVASPQTQPITESVAGCSRDSLPYNPHVTTSNSPNKSEGAKGSEGKVVGFVLPTTIKPFNSPPEILNATEDSAAEYRLDEEETTTMACIGHPDVSSVAGCEHCLHMYCLTCLCKLKGQADCELNSCVEGKQHSTFPREELTLRLKRKLISNLDLRLSENQQVKLESEAMLQDKINKLHQQRDKEMELKAAEIRSKYKSREDMIRSRFSEDTKVKELDNHINILESKKRRIELSTHAHQLVLQGFILRELQSIPIVRGQMKLRTIGGADNNKVEIIHTRSPPTLSTLQKSIELRLNQNVERVCHYKGVTCIAYMDYIDSVDKEGCVTNIITNTPDIWDIAVYNNKIFLLTSPTVSHGGRIIVYTLKGELITTWSPSHICDSITLSGDLLVLSAPYIHPLLLIYTEEGEKVRQVSISTSGRLYPVDSKSVIVCNGSVLSYISRVDISTGADMWRRDDISPRGAVYDEHGNLLVWDRETQSIQILDISSGETLRCVSYADLINIIGGRNVTSFAWYWLAITEDDVLTITGRFFTNTWEERRACLYITLLYDDNHSLVIAAQ